MLVQSLPLNSTIANLAELCQALRSEKKDLTELKLPASMLVFDVMKAMGLPDEAVRMVLSYQEFQAISAELFIEATSQDNDGGTILKCQFCEEEALHLAKVRGAWVLVCEDCESKTKHG